MKTTLAIIALFVSNVAFAVDFGSGDDFSNVQYLSWCVKTQIMGHDQKGHVVLKMDCATYQKKCVQLEKPTGNVVVSFARCE